MKAVIPAAGLGTRFLPATKSQPKEMLPVVDKPAIQYVVEEAVASGIDDILIITGRGKRAIEDHFDRAVELEHHLEQRGKHELLASLRAITELADQGHIHYIRQREQRGLGDAVLTARHHVGDEPFALLLGDDIIEARRPCTRQLMDIFEEHKAPVIALERVPRERLSSYGVVAARPLASGLHRITALVEKPGPSEAPSDLAVMGRYVLTPDIFDILETLPPGKGGELQLTDGLGLLAGRRPLLGLEFSGRRYDIGDKLDWLKATVELALERQEFGQELAGHLGALLERKRRAKRGGIGKSKKGAVGTREKRQRD